MATTKELQRRIEQLEAIVERFTGRTASRATPLRPEDRADYIKQGSDKHATFLGLVRANEDETLVCDGWTLLDSTLYGPNVTEKFLERILAQKVNELNTPMPMPQSKDPTAPHFAPVLWDPSIPLAQITED